MSLGLDDDFFFFAAVALAMSLILVGCKPVPPAPVPIVDLRNANACPADLGPPQPCADIFTVDKVPVPCARCQGAEGCFDKDDGLYCVRGTCTSDPRCKLLGADVPDGGSAYGGPDPGGSGSVRFSMTARTIQSAGVPRKIITAPTRIFIGQTIPDPKGFKLTRTTMAPIPREAVDGWGNALRVLPCEGLLPEDFYQYKEVWCRNRQSITVHMLVEKVQP